ncbi:MAG: flagellar biosynthesis anti-sigma factor FlgM [Firmicutes bacterium]|nr:flagellar biosynthesis anti-sigma factor FlgM [Bacillota bacterium]
MKINSLYTLLINRFKINERLQPSSEGPSRPPREARGDRSELSRLVAALKEAERQEGESDPLQAARLDELQEKIDAGTYKIDLNKLAAAMLKPAGK